MDIYHTAQKAGIEVRLHFNAQPVTRTAQPLLLGPADGTHFSIGELSGSIVLKNLEPRLEFDLKDSKLLLKIG